MADDRAYGVLRLCYNRAFYSLERNDAELPMTPPPRDAFIEEECSASISIEFSSIVKWMLELLISPPVSLVPPPATYSFMSLLRARCAARTRGWQGKRAYELECRNPTIDD